MLEDDGYYLWKDRQDVNDGEKKQMRRDKSGGLIEEINRGNEE